MRKIAAPSAANGVPMVGDGRPNVSSDGDNTPYDLVVVHSAVMRNEPGAARALARMNGTSTTGSWHYATDADEAVQCSWDSIICWADGVNYKHIAIEMADWPVPWPTGDHPPSWWVTFRRRWRWALPRHRRMLRRTARLTARLLLAGDLPVLYRSAAELRAGKRRGWTTHAQVTEAFHRSVHWDPGAWPRKKFDALVHQYATELRQEARR